MLEYSFQGRCGTDLHSRSTKRGPGGERFQEGLHDNIENLPAKVLRQQKSKEDWGPQKWSSADVAEGGKKKKLNVTKGIYPR